MPQKEVHPPAEVGDQQGHDPRADAKVGHEIIDGKGLCFTCHTIGKSGALRFPDLDGHRQPRRPRARRASATSTTWPQSLYDPNLFIVPGFNPGMPVINKPPIGLTDQEILAVIAYLQSLGGKADGDAGLQAPWPLAARGGGAVGAMEALPVARGPELAGRPAQSIARAASLLRAAAARARSPGRSPAGSGSTSFVRYGFATPIPLSVVQIYMGDHDASRSRPT